LRLAARVGLGAGIVSLGCLMWVASGLLPVVGELSSRQSAAVALYGSGMLLALGSCGFVASQENALRHKFLLVVALLGAIVALTGLSGGMSAVFGPPCSRCCGIIAWHGRPRPARPAFFVIVGRRLGDRVDVRDILQEFLVVFPEILGT